MRMPPTPDVLGKLAATLMMAGRLNEAITALKEEVRMSPSSSVAHFTLGQVYLQQKEYEQAGASYKAAIQIEPDLARAYYGLARVHSRLGNRAEVSQIVTPDAGVSPRASTQMRTTRGGRSA